VKSCAMGKEVVAEPSFCVVLHPLCMIGIVSMHRTGVFNNRTLNDLLVCQNTDQSRMNELERSWGISHETTLRV
jgi:hypothetical protein